MSDNVENEEGQVLILGELRLDFDDIGEGYGGDYDPDDEEDVELLRFSLYHLENDEWVEVDNASYCTNVPASTPMAERQRILEGLLGEIAANFGDGNSVKHLCEGLSWVGPEWYLPCEYPNCIFDARTTLAGRRLCGSHAAEYHTASSR